MMVGIALGCSIARHSKWDRKNYYYPDLPKGYQISQYDLPLCHDGKVDIVATAGGTRAIGIIRAHLEEDTGKLGHDLPGGHHYAGSLVDLNRAGTPLLEVVTAPDFDCADERSDHHPYEEEVHLMIHGDTVAAALAVAAAAAALAGQ